MTYNVYTQQVVFFKDTSYFPEENISQLFIGFTTSHLISASNTEKGIGNTKKNIALKSSLL